MASALQSTVWPSGPQVPPEAKELLARFFQLVDDKNEDAGRRLAEDLFFDNADWKLPFVTFSGKEDIRKSRSAFWKGVTFRHHQIDRVFFGDLQGLDLLCLGKFSAGHEDGSTETADFAGRMLMKYDQDGKVRLRLAQAWAGDTLKA